MIAPARIQTCLVPNCGRPAGPSRGVCNACYALAKRLVIVGDASWEELERLGLVRGPIGTRRGHAPFRVALAQARTATKAGKHHAKAKGKR